MDGFTHVCQGADVTVEAALADTQTIDTGGAIPLGRDGSGRGLAAFARVCSNPACTCQDLVLEVGTFSVDGDRPVRPEQTRLRVRMSMADGSHAFEWTSGPSGEADAPPPDGLRERVEAALEDFEVRSRLRERWRRARGQAGDPRFPLPEPPLDLDRMVYFGEAFPYDFDIAVEHRGRSYAALHAHCLRPGCTCAEMMIDIIGPDAAEARAFVRVPVRLPRQIKEAEAPWARLVWTKLVDRYGAGFFAERHRRMMALVPTSTPLGRTPTVSRNALCPCGSGKKRKRCCG